MSRLAIQQNNNHMDQIEFPIHDFIISKDREMEFLAKVADILILFLSDVIYQLSDENVNNSVNSLCENRLNSK